MSENVEKQEANSQVLPVQPSATSAETVNTGKTADGREAYIPRERFDQVHEENKTLKSRLDELERKDKERVHAEMSEVERLKAERDELAPFKTQVQTYSQVIEQVLEAELASVPEDKRNLIEGDTPAAKLKDLARLKTLGLFAPQQPITQPAAPKTNAAEGARQKAEQAPVDAEDIVRFKKMGWTDEEIAKYAKKRGS